MKKTFLFFFIALVLGSCEAQTTSPAVAEKFNGVSFVGNPKPISPEALEKVIDINANSITLMPFGYGRASEAHLTFENLDWQWWGESAKGVESCIQQAQAKGMKVIIKPQLWFNHGSFTGHHTYDNNADWELFEADYTKFIMIFAKLSEKYHLPVFCIGTELCAFAEERPEYWSSLIKSVRDVYKGKLTYAANWDSYTRMPFWNELDYIGVDAYFPLSSSETPTAKELQRAWYPICRKLEKMSKEYDKPFLFMEWGYRSTNFCADKPWETGKSDDVNLQAQAIALEAVFTEVWDQPWFAGGFVWKWFPEYTKAGGSDDNRFTPQNKPGEQVIQRYFQQYD
ncbi:MAG: glycoside hydrolase [Flavobacteriales bacterium]|nr:glycoside hydrolase [Flavobacteriales bacterium]MDG1779938.1 glycoside hydrolase [Flavobacteriales bacterium]MDG2245744.1 glycoside hydrolase [Flavobacteriales bacterium]